MKILEWYEKKIFPHKFDFCIGWICGVSSLCLLNVII